MSVQSDETLQRSLEMIPPLGVSELRSRKETVASDAQKTGQESDSFSAHPSSEKVASSKAIVLQLAGLVDGPQSLEPYIDQTLSLVANVYGAHTVVLWMTDPTSADAVFRICNPRTGPTQIPASFDSSIPDQLDVTSEQNLISQAWNCEHGTLHFSELGQRKEDSRVPATISRLFAPIRHFDRTIAMLDITLPPFTTATPSAETRQRLIASASLIAARIYSGLRRRMPLPSASPNAARTRLQNASQSVDAIREQIRLKIEKEVAQLAGWSFSTLAENQEIAKEIHRLLDAHSLRVQCNECGNAAILRCIKAGNAKRGVFVFDHYLDDGRTFHGGTSSIPDLRVVPRPARRSNTSETSADN